MTTYCTAQRGQDVRSFDLVWQRKDRLETSVNHINNLGAPMMHQPSYYRVHLCLEVPVQKTRNVHKSMPQQVISDNKQQQHK